jgi:hypothetical protein
VFGCALCGYRDLAARREEATMRSSSTREIQRIDAMLSVLVRQRHDVQDPRETWRFTDVINKHLDERLALMHQRADLSPARASGPGE